LPARCRGAPGAALGRAPSRVLTELLNAARRTPLPANGSQSQGMHATAPGPGAGERAAAVSGSAEPMESKSKRDQAGAAGLDRVAPFGLPRRLWPARRARKGRDLVAFDFQSSNPRYSTVMLLLALGYSHSP